MCAADRILLLGASGQIGRFVQSQWKPAHGKLLPASRKKTEHGVQLDLSRDVLPACEYILSAGPLDLLVQALQRTSPDRLQRVVAFSSTSAISKLTSSDAEERALAARLLQAENRLQDWCDTNGVQWVIIRPTLVHGGPNRNLQRVAMWLRRYRLVPYLWPGNGLRQPVHASDLAWLARRCLFHTQAPGRRWIAAGGETLSYRQMLVRVRQAVGKGVLLPVPAWSVAWLRYWRPGWQAMLNRQLEDLCFDDQETRARLGWNPPAFRTLREELLQDE